MKKTIKALILMAAVSGMAAPVVATNSIDGGKLFSKKCNMCHALDKRKVGPAVKSMSQDEVRLRNVITNGGKIKMMKAYGKKFSSDQIDALVAYIRSKQ
jgi:mono/diheme cytochrome c family protein